MIRDWEMEQKYRAIYLHAIESQKCPLCYASFFKIF